jgi:hypothetical protein
MPSKEPAPSAGTAEQAGPNGLSMAVSLPEPAMLSSDAEADAAAFGEESDVVESEPLSEQALRASGRTAAAARVTAVRRIRVFTMSLLWVTAARAAFSGEGEKGCRGSGSQGVRESGFSRR